jgi:UDP-N-acetyl-D-mannosaminuronic acid dehydrogenase
MGILNVNVYGLGYIGLPTAVLLADQGFVVSGIEVKFEAVKSINNGISHFVEPGLDKMLKSVVASGNLTARLDAVSADVHIICVPTPVDGGDIPSPNIESVLDVAKVIVPVIRPTDMVIIESTCPVGTTSLVQSIFVEEGVPVDRLRIAYCPERVLPGNIMLELTENDRIVGGVNDASSREVADFYRTFVKGNVVSTDSKTAELCKLAENSYRDVNIAFANELSLLCAKENIDVQELIKLANHHPRVDILAPGVGVGGHCIAVDPWFIVSKDPENSKLIRTARNVNLEKTLWVINEIEIALEGLSKNDDKPKTVAFFGLTFKPDVDDLRESPALEVALHFTTESVSVVAVDPNVETLDHLALTTTDQALLKADLVVLLVKHREFTLQSFKGKLQPLNVLDYCGILN